MLSAYDEASLALTLAAGGESDQTGSGEHQGIGFGLGQASRIESSQLNR